MKHQTFYLSLNHFLATFSLSIALVTTPALATAEPSLAEAELPAQASALEQVEALIHHQNPDISIFPDARTVEEQNLYLVQMERILHDDMTESLLDPTYQDLSCGLSNVFIAFCSSF